MRNFTQTSLFILIWFHGAVTLNGDMRSKCCSPRSKIERVVSTCFSAQQQPSPGRGEKREIPPSLGPTQCDFFSFPASCLSLPHTRNSYTLLFLMAESEWISAGGSCNQKKKKVWKKSRAASDGKRRKELVLPPLLLNIPSWIQMFHFLILKREFCSVDVS